MNKTDLAEAVALSTGLPFEKTYAVMQALMTCIGDEVAAGGRIAVPGLGTFSLIERKARKGRNPRTGEVMDIPAKKTIKFKPGKQLTDSLD